MIRNIFLSIIIFSNVYAVDTCRIFNIQVENNSVYENVAYINRFFCQYDQDNRIFCDFNEDFTKILKCRAFKNGNNLSVFVPDLYNTYFYEDSSRNFVPLDQNFYKVFLDFSLNVKKDEYFEKDKKSLYSEFLLNNKKAEKDATKISELSDKFAVKEEDLRIFIAYIFLFFFFSLFFFMFNFRSK
jgi:hypothetical protein